MIIAWLRLDYYMYIQYTDQHNRLRPDYYNTEHWITWSNESRIKCFNPVCCHDNLIGQNNTILKENINNYEYCIHNKAKYRISLIFSRPRIDPALCTQVLLSKINPALKQCPHNNEIHTRWLELQVQQYSHRSTEDSLVYCKALEGWQLMLQQRSRLRQLRSLLATTRTLCRTERTCASTLDGMCCRVILTLPSNCTRVLAGTEINSTHRKKSRKYAVQWPRVQLLHVLCVRTNQQHRFPNLITQHSTTCTECSPMLGPTLTSPLESKPSSWFSSSSMVRWISLSPPE